MAKYPDFLKEYGEPKTLPSYTYKYDPVSKHISGHIDGMEAVAQSIYCYLNIERYEWEIFPTDYGVEMRDLFGQDPEIVTVLLEQRIKDCLSIDTRIKDIKDFECRFMEHGRIILVKFTVVSTEGTFDMGLDFSKD